MIISFLFHIVANAIAILASARFVPGVSYRYELFSLIKIALILAAANYFLKPILKIIFSPLIFITLGLFTLIINIFLIWLVVRFTPEISIVGFKAYFETAVIISFLNFAVSLMLKR